MDPLAEKYPEWGSYNYVLQNPVKWTDSTGMCPDSKCHDGIFDDGYKHTTDDGKIYYYMAEDNSWSDEGVVINHKIINYEKDKKIVRYKSWRYTMGSMCWR